VYWVALELPWFWCHSECGVEGPLRGTVFLYHF
jgi:hypothetical protein